MIVRTGEKLMVVEKRLFDGDTRRLFLGQVEALEGGVARVTGTTWGWDPEEETYVCRDEIRTRIVSLTSGQALIYVLPPATNLRTMDVQREGQTLIARDGEGFKMNVAFGDLRRKGPPPAKKK